MMWRPTLLALLLVLPACAGAAPATAGGPTWISEPWRAALWFTEVEGLTERADDLIVPLEWSSDGSPTLRLPEGTPAPSRDIDWQRARGLYLIAARRAETPERREHLEARASQCRLTGTAQRRYERAYRLVKDGELEHALEQLADVPSDSPWESAAGKLEAFIELRLKVAAIESDWLSGKQQAALAALEQLAATIRGPNRAVLERRHEQLEQMRSLAKQARTELQKGNWIEAIELAELGLRADPFIDRAGDNEPRRQLLDCWHGASDKWAEALVAALKAALQAGDADEALAKIRRIGAVAPDDTWPEVARRLVRQRKQALFEEARNQADSPDGRARALTIYDLLLEALESRDELRIKVLYYRAMLRKRMGQ